MKPLSGRAISWLLALAAVPGMAVPPRAVASMILAMDLPALTARADRIVVAEVMSVSSNWDRAHKVILTTVQLNISESWKGATPTDRTLTIVQRGGVADGIEMRVHGMPLFKEGERSVLFLQGEANFTVVGWEQGKRNLRFDTAAARWMVDPSPAVSGSAVVKADRQGLLVPMDRPQPSLRLEDLRRQVRALRALLKP